MDDYEQCLGIMTQLFSKDIMFYLVIVKDHFPSVRIVDTFL